MTKSATFADVLVALERQYPTYETDLSIRAEIQNLAVLPNNPKPARNLRAACRLGPLGRATDARFLRQRRAAILVGGEAPMRTVG